MVYFTLLPAAQGKDIYLISSVIIIQNHAFQNSLLLTLLRRRRACRALTDSKTANCICGALFRSGDLGKHGGQAGL